MKIKVFKSHLSELEDTNSIESKINSFIKNKTIVSIEQSVVPKIQRGTKPECIYFTVITILYED